MKICMLGAGTLGSSIGGILALGGSDVFLVDPYEKHVEAINQKGLKLHDGKTDITVPIKAYSDCKNLPIVDLIIILVKSAHTGEAIESAKTLIGEKPRSCRSRTAWDMKKFLHRQLAVKTFWQLRLIWAASFSGQARPCHLWRAWRNHLYWRTRRLDHAARTSRY